MNYLQKLHEAALKVLKQGNTSANRDGACAYRGEHNRRCAIGQLIPDHLYRPDMEGVCADHFTMRPCMAQIGFDTPESIEAADMLQCWHDRLPTAETYPSVQEWQAAAIKKLPSFIDKEVIRRELENS